MQPNRWRYASAAIVMQICLGVIYSWSVFRGPLSEAYGWNKSMTITPYRYSILFFTFAMVVAGFWQDKKGPRLVGSVGGFLLGTGCLLAAFIGDTVTGLSLAYGVVAGVGVGFAYVTPIATCIKWFPDKRGMIVGMAVMGFGAGPLLFGPLLEALIGRDPAQMAATLPRTFLIMAAIFYVFVIGAAQLYRVPPAGWKPEGWKPPAVTSKPRKEEFGAGEMLRTWQFYGLWLLYFLGTSVGLTAIGETTPLIQELAKDAPMTGGMALGLMSIFNAGGRMAWGSFSDRFGRNVSVACMCGFSIAACLFLLPDATNFWQVLAGLCMVGFAYGGYLAIMPSFTADYYGPINVGANYGILFSAWGVCGYLVPGYFASIMDKARQSGNLAAGYNEVYQTLALLAIVGGAMAFVVRRPGGKP